MTYIKAFAEKVELSNEDVITVSGEGNEGGNQGGGNQGGGNQGGGNQGCGSLWKIFGQSVHDAF